MWKDGELSNGMMKRGWELRCCVTPRPDRIWKEQDVCSHKRKDRIPQQRDDSECYLYWMLAENLQDGSQEGVNTLRRKAGCRSSRK